ncbi:MAG: hypothetical protein R6V01_06765 [Thermoplasmatota archaeon]
MKVCIVVHSKTGTTLKFAEKIMKELRDRKHRVELVGLEIEPPDWQGRPKDGKEFEIKNLPDCSPHDAVIIGCPVWGASATPIIIKAISDVKGLSGKKVVPFSTQSFPFSFLGGNRTLRMIGREAEKKGAKVLPGSNVCKMFHDVSKKMEEGARDVASRL